MLIDNNSFFSQRLICAFDVEIALINDIGSLSVFNGEMFGIEDMIHSFLRQQHFTSESVRASEVHEAARVVC